MERTILIAMVVMMADALQVMAYILLVRPGNKKNQTNEKSDCEEIW